MKIIIDTDLAAVDGATVIDNITSVVASDSDGSFPVANLRDDFTTNLWKATGVSAKLYIQLSKGHAIALFNTNATTAVVTAGFGESYVLETWYSLEDGYSLADDAMSTTVIENLPGVNGNLWINHTSYLVPYTVVITLTASTNVYAGIVRGGVVESFTDPVDSGFSESSQDFSIEKELNNGASYFRKRNIVKEFSGLTFFESRGNAYVMKHDIFDKIGPKPLAIFIMSNNLSEKEFVGFMKRTEPPTINYSGTGTFSQVTLSIKEVI